MVAPPVIRDATADDLPFITDLLNHYVRTSTCIWTESPYTIEERRRWLADSGRRHPATVCESAGELLGYGALGPFRAKSGYDLTVEHSVYVRPDCHRQGLGALLLADLVARARTLGHHAMIAGISADQEASIRLHRAHGFIEVARLPQSGRKHGRWLDLVFMQLLLDTSPNPPI